MPKKIYHIEIICFVLALGCAEPVKTNYTTDPFLSQSATIGAVLGETIIVKGKFFAYTFKEVPPNDYTGELTSVKVHDPQLIETNNQAQIYGASAYQNQYSAYPGYQPNPYAQYNPAALLNPYAAQTLDPFVQVGVGLKAFVLNSNDAAAYYDLKPQGVSSSRGRIYLTAFDGEGIESFRLVMNEVGSGINPLFGSPNQPDFPVEAFLRWSDGSIYAAGVDYTGTDGAVFLGEVKKDEDIDQLLNPYQDTEGYFYLQMKLIERGTTATSEDTQTTNQENDQDTDPTTSDPDQAGDDIPLVSFRTQVLPALQQNDCGSCHSSTDAAGTLVLNMADQEDTYFKLKGYINDQDTSAPESSQLIQILTVGSSVSHAGVKPITDENSSIYTMLYWWIAAGSPLN